MFVGKQAAVQFIQPGGARLCTATGPSAALTLPAAASRGQWKEAKQGHQERHSLNEGRCKSSPPVVWAEIPNSAEHESGEGLRAGCAKHVIPARG
eukprot:scaffold137346_cov148-Phaeocystis_antarctica.AAC.5